MLQKCDKLRSEIHRISGMPDTFDALYEYRYGSSVLVAVRRKIDGEYKIDPSYEVYAEQLEFVHRSKKLSIKEKFKNILEELRENWEKGSE